MDSIAGTKSSLTWAVNISVVVLVVLWLIPTIGLLVSSFRDRDQISASAWWEAPLPVEQAYRLRAEGEVRQDGGLWVIEGNVFDASEMVETFPAGSEHPPVAAFGITGREPGATAAGQEAENRDGGTLVVNADGSYVFTTNEEPGDRPPRIYVVAETPPEFTTENYNTVLGGDGMGQAFINTLTVTIPATVIPILIAAFAAYALAWMDFPGRGLLIAAVVGLLVVPLQLALVPLLSLHQQVGIGQSFVGIWLAHTGFGLPLAIYLLRNYMVGLPRDIIESAKVDGATDFQIFTKIILPLSFPALASFAIFQFLWTWNDLLVAKVFLPSSDESWVMTVRIADDLLGSRGGDWGILAAAAFVSIAVPLVVFFSMQRYLVRGLLAGSVK
ncbi:ABC transporter permease subunit [Roseobacter sp. HKCCD9010]|uniref:carbohydrate ABC transporter permease n=1 Tax=unclassified Roseobacter TaxID=196798 RepID=UPI001492DB24|nr:MULTISPECIES: carbohydrate ABC transporter permease [unclassified Roseobacter]MBF9050172.1 ABC transporter permease subunit [Rhodobacterales bacterium HKCCD4356]NNV12415.1 ABC transporter permease subunit [Roseobacter sp. HKCCD7357]NNV16121.1 ABC transporter permease subunit [Roseobacter sp. HKCCD8768]NNV25581.1 ABC transporter permease subunit [Roseobacter sp. HKCCD8192]NNV29837.1 ABC transporter permease subunit [Roseobacter sp. HKCCD9061]